MRVNQDVINVTKRDGRKHGETIAFYSLWFLPRFEIHSSRRLRRSRNFDNYMHKQCTKEMMIKKLFPCNKTKCGDFEKNLYNIRSWS